MAEVSYLRDHEWVVQAHDLLWRRSKLGLRLTPAQQQRLAEVLQQHAPAPVARIAG
jgi:glycerol-3-phosphate dehydrogenase